jgi:hypothetical protein
MNSPQIITIEVQSHYENLEYEMNITIKKLQRIETQEYRNITSKDIIDIERKKYTAIFKHLLTIKEQSR